MGERFFPPSHKLLRKINKLVTKNVFQNPIFLGGGKRKGSYMEMAKLFGLTVKMVTVSLVHLALFSISSFVFHVAACIYTIVLVIIC